ncbi:hypothetical protein BGX27_004638, partial [Mortierella sp. AM989]
MPSLIQVDGKLLERLTQLGPAVGQDIQVFENITEIAADNPTLNSNNRTKSDFQPQRKYFLEGRIIHKRKLSRKLFFLDVTLVRQKHALDGNSTVESVSWSPSVLVTNPFSCETLETKGADGFMRSNWEDIDSNRGTARDHHSPPNNSLCLRMEVIARYPAHSLKELDNLWQRVQLGSIIKVYGDIEISEKHTGFPSDIANGSDENNQGHQLPRWSALLHCLDFEVLEPWQGTEGFEPNPGSSMISGSSKNESNQAGAGKKNKKRKNEEQIGNLSESMPGEQQELGSLAKQQRGDESQPHCKFWLNSGKCNKEQCLFWHETDMAKLKIERRRWVEERIQAKLRISHHTSDPHQKTTKNQHRERALYFAHWLIKFFTRDFLNSGSGVLDIAGGRGDLSWELQTRQGIQSTIVEPRPGKGMRKWQRKWLQKFKVDNQHESPVSLPESEATQATDPAVDPTDDPTDDPADDPEDQEPDDGK